jgi:alkylation response protein AidB-like acyl-CoA dehydrogenase
MSETISDGQTEQIALLRDSASRFARENADHKRFRALREQPPGYHPPLLGEIAELGWLGIVVPERYGGLGLGFQEMAVVLEELGRGLIAEPLGASAVLATRALLHGDNEALKQRLLPDAVGGTGLLALAWSEVPGSLDPGEITTAAAPTGDGVTLNGRKRFVAGAGGAAGFLVTARNSAGVAVYWVPRAAPGLSIDYEWRADGTPSGVLTLADVAVPAADVAASAAVACEAVARAVDEAAVMAAAEAYGVMDAALEMTLAYMRTRVQYDKPIGSFQALQHMAVDIYMEKEIAGSVIAEAVRALDGSLGADERTRITCRAKSRASDTALRVCRQAIQLHGAIGYTDEYDIGLYLKRALVLSAWLGNAAQQRRRYAASAFAVGGDGSALL